MNKIKKLKGVTYDWRIEEFPNKGFSEERQIGLIAQEVEKVIPELINTDDEGYKTVSYEKLTPLLVEAIKEQQAQLDALKSQNQALRLLVCEDHPSASICVKN